MSAFVKHSSLEILSCSGFRLELTASFVSLIFNMNSVAEKTGIYVPLKEGELSL